MPNTKLAAGLTHIVERGIAFPIGFDGLLEFTVASDAGETRDGCGNGHGSSSRVDAMETTLANWNRCKPEILKNGA